MCLYRIRKNPCANVVYTCPVAMNQDEGLVTD